MSEEFSREITKQAVARACTALEYKNVQLSVIESLADVVRNYVECIGDHTRDIAEHAGRAIPGVQDVISSLDAMQHKHLNTTWKELRDFALVDGETVGEDMDSSTVWCQPFPVAIPSFPAKRRRREILQPVGESVPEHMPQHLPPFPPAHTYKRTQPARKVKKASASSSSHIEAAKSVQESLAILEGVSSSRKRGRSEASVVGSKSKLSTVTDESNPTAMEAPQRILNTGAGPVQSLPREEKILLGVPVYSDNV